MVQCPHVAAIEPASVQGDAHVLLRLAVENERRAPISVRGIGIARERKGRRDDGSVRIEVELERDLVDHERRRTIIGAPLQRRA